MNIAIVSLDNSNRVTLGGKHVHQQLLKRALEKMDHKVVTIFPERNLYYLSARVIYKILTHLGLTNNGKVFAWTLDFMCRSLEKKIRSCTQIEAIFSQDPVSAVAAQRGTKGQAIPIVLTLHGYLSLESVNYGNYSESEKPLVIEHARMYEREALNAAQRVITVDTRISNYLKTEFNYNRPLTVLKNAIDPTPFALLSTQEIQAERKQLEIPLDKKIILVPRRLVKKNGVQVALKALAELKKQGYQNYFVLVMGGGPEFSNLQSLQMQLQLRPEDLRFLGDVDHKYSHKYYSMADIVLVPSVISDGIEEATSLSMLEGMAAKKVVIVSDIGGMKEVIAHGNNGYLFNQNNHEELARLIIQISSNPPSEVQKVIDQGFADVCAHHHYERHAEQYLEQVTQWLKPKISK